MVLINNLTVDEINAALIHLQRSRNEVVGGEKGDTVQNITINNQGGGADYSSVINAIENRVKNTETNINTLDSSQRMLALETAGMQEQIADIYNTLLSMSQNNITDISWDDINRVLVINTTSMSYEVAIPSETVALSLEGNVLTFTMGEQTTSVTLNYIPTSEKGAANGVATLDSSGRIPYSQLPESAMEFLGEWDASTNTPHLEDGTGDNGDFYVVSVGGTVNFGTQAEPRNITFYPNDRVVYEGSLDKWFRLPAGEVRTVNGLSGDVILNGTNVNYDNTNNSPTLKSKIDSVETKAETQADWNISDSTNLAYIKNKPALKPVATSGSYNDLTNKPTIPAAQIQSDWTQTDTTKKDYIKHKIPIWITPGSASDNMQPVDVVQEGNSKPVTSNAVAEIMESLPTDAVLHYSFDEVPDLPDGTAKLKYDNNFTDTTGWAGSATVSVSNGKLVFDATTGQYKYYAISLSANDIIVLKGIATKSATLTVMVRHSGASSDTGLKSVALTQGQYFEIAVVVDATSTNFNLYSPSAWGVTISQLYIGNGSYTTPVIDNANGEWNSISQSGVAVQGVSGKGLKGFKGSSCAKISNFNFTDDFTVSLWVNPANNTPNLDGDILFKTECFVLRNGFNNGSNMLMFVWWNTSTSAYVVKDLMNTLLPANVWQHLVLIKSGTSIKFYINTILKTTQTLANSSIGKNDSDLILHRGTSYTRETSYDDLLIFNRALSETEVTALYFNKANTPKYFPQPTDKIEQDNWGLATSGGVYSFINNKFSSFSVYEFFTPDYTKYILLADITKWYNSNSSSEVQAVGFIGKFIRYRTAGYVAQVNADITLSVGYYRGGVTLPNTQRTDIAKNNISNSNYVSVGVIQYQDKYYLAIRLNTIQSAYNYFFGYASQNPLLTLLTNSDTVTEIYIV